MSIIYVVNDVCLILFLLYSRIFYIDLRPVVFNMIYRFEANVG